jgi:hypothetical protein
MSQSFLKAALDGLNGAGKSGTAARLAVGISKEFCGSAPVLVFDSEERYRFYKVTIFDVEGVPLLVYPGKSLVALQIFSGPRNGPYCSNNRYSKFL